jgi:hypothetical protein
MIWVLAVLDAEEVPIDHTLPARVRDHDLVPYLTILRRADDATWVHRVSLLGLALVDSALALDLVARCSPSMQVARSTRDSTIGLPSSERQTRRDLTCGPSVERSTITPGRARPSSTFGPRDRDHLHGPGRPRCQLRQPGFRSSDDWAATPDSSKPSRGPTRPSVPRETARATSTDRRDRLF